MPHLTFRPVPLRVLVGWALLVGGPSALQAQSAKAPKRPRLEVGADTNYAPTYYAYGISVLEKDPVTAADAFYWASRIDPTWAQPLYARRIALLISNPRFLVGYMNGTRRYVDSKEARSLDSLELHALMLDPFLVRELDRQLIVAFVRALFEVDPANAESVRLDYFIEKYMRNDASNRIRALMAIAEGRVPDALDLYRKAVSEDRDAAAAIHVERARAFHMLGNDDSTRAELTAALERLRKKEDKFVYVYESKALLEQCVGLTYEMKAQFEPAREAYGRALQEDLSYYPAHIRLGAVALATGDTTTALSEMDLAVQIKGDDPWVRATYGATLAQTGRAADAAVQLQKAVALEPFYPGPYYLLGRLSEALGKPADAAEAYRNYLAHASTRDVRVADVRQRLGALGATASERP
ncbi:MAG TPA: tetratricopeptide repeat protein [Gemmatimonadales bacterium]|nr:tetratricopeptide repeat protein [Gemmatimonadales bacterium]